MRESNKNNKKKRGWKATEEHTDNEEIPEDMYSSEIINTASGECVYLMNKYNRDQLRERRILEGHRAT